MRGLSFSEGAAALAPGDGGPRDIAAGALRGAARPVDGRHAARFAETTGADVGRAREHSGPEAQAACAALGVEGFALGDDIAYAKSAPRDEVRYHELAHVAQRGSRGIKTFGGAGGLERNADAVARAATSGRRAEVAAGDPGLAGFGKDDLEGSFGTGDVKTTGKRKNEYEQPAKTELTADDIPESEELTRIKKLIAEGKLPDAYAALAMGGALRVDPNVVVGLDVGGELDALLNGLGYATLWSSGNRETTRAILRAGVPENNTRRALNLVVKKVVVKGKGDKATTETKLHGGKGDPGKGGGDDEAYAAYQIIKCLPAGERKRFLEGEHAGIYASLCGLLNLSQLESDDLNMYQGGKVDPTTGKADDSDRQAILAELDDPKVWQAKTEVERAHLENLMRMAVAAGHRPDVTRLAEKHGALEAQLELLSAVLGPDLTDDGQRDMTKKEANKAVKGGRMDMGFEAWDALVTMPFGIGKDKEHHWGGRSGRMGRIGTRVEDDGPDDELHDFEKTKGKRKDGYELGGVELDEIQDIYGKEAGIMGFKFARAGLDDKRQQKKGEVAGKDYIADDDVNRVDAVISWDQGLLWIASEKGLALESINYPLGEMTIKSGALTTGKLKFNATFPPKATQEKRTGKEYEGTRAASMRLELERLEINDFMIVMADNIMVINKVVVTDLLLTSESAPGTLADLETAEDAAAHIMASESIGKGTSGLARLLQAYNGPALGDLSAGISSNAFMGEDGGGTRLSCKGLDVTGITMSGGMKIGKISAKNLDFQVRRMPSEILAARRDGLKTTIGRQDVRDAELDQALAALDLKIGATTDTKEKEKLTAQRELMAHQRSGIARTRTESQAELDRIATFTAHAAVLDKYAGPKAKAPEAGEEVPPIVGEYTKWVGTSGSVGMLQADAFELSGFKDGKTDYGDYRAEGVSGMGGGASLTNMVGKQFESLAGKAGDAPGGGKFAGDDNFRASVDALTLSGGNIGVPETKLTDVRTSLTDADAVDGESKDPTKRLSIEAGTVSTDPSALAKGFGAEVQPLATKDLKLAVTGSGNPMTAGAGAFYDRKMKVEVGVGPIHTGAVGFVGGGVDFQAAGLDLGGLTATIDVELHKNGDKTELAYGHLHELTLPRLSASAAHLKLPVKGQVAEIEVPTLAIEGLAAKNVPLTGFDAWSFAGEASLTRIVAEASVGMGEHFKAGTKIEANDLSLGAVGDEVRFDLGNLDVDDVFVDSKEDAPAGSFAAMIGKLGGKIKKLDDLSAHARYDKKTGMASADLALPLLDVGAVSVAAGGKTIGASGARVELLTAAARVELDQDAIAEKVFRHEAKKDEPAGDKTEEKPKPPMFGELIKKIHVDDLGIHKLEGNDVVYNDGKNDVTCKRGYLEELCVHGVTLDPAADKGLLPFLSDVDASLGELGIEGMVARIQTGKAKDDILRASLTTHARGLTVKRANNGATTFDLGDFDVDDAKIGTGLDGGSIDVAAVLKNLGGEFTLGDKGLSGTMKLGSLTVPHVHYSGMGEDGMATDVAGGPMSLTDARVKFSVGLTKKPAVGGKPGGIGLGKIELESLHVGPTSAESLEVLRYKREELLALGTRLVDLYGFELDDKEKEKVALDITRSMATKTIKKAAFDALDMKGIELDLADGMFVKSKSFDLSGLDVDVHNGGKKGPEQLVPDGAKNAEAARENLRGEMGELIRMKGDLHAGAFSYHAPKSGGMHVDLEDFRASEFFASYRGVGGTLDEMKAKKLTVDQDDKDGPTKIEVEQAHMKGKLDDQSMTGKKEGGLGTPAQWPEYVQEWSLPLLDNLDGMVNLSIPFKNTMLDLPVRIVEGKIDTTPAWIAKAVAPHQYAVAEEVGGEMMDMGIAGKHMSAQDRMKALNELGAGLLENLVIPLLVDIVGWFDPDFMHVRNLVEKQMNAKYGMVPAVDGKIPMEKSIQDMLEDAIQGMGGWSILIDYFAPQGEGFFVSTGKALVDWCRTWLPYCLGGRSEEEQQAVWRGKVERRARVLADMLTDVHVGDESVMIGKGGISATRAPVKPGIDEQGKPIGDHLIGKHVPCLRANGEASMSLSGALSSGLTLGTQMMYSDFWSDMGTMTVQGKGVAGFGQGTIGTESRADGSITRANTSDTEGGLHADKLTLMLKSDKEIKGEKRHEKWGLNGSEVEQEKLLAIETAQFTQRFGRAPKSYAERSGFREFQEWAGQPSPLSKVTNDEIEPVHYKDAYKNVIKSATGMPGFVVDKVVSKTGA
ncbi:MAG: DUF4157 domain-containing protein [Deltaproteobacteria bacterium]|nr:DUF4157 domain-containing protein [Deltaproteobacteria bacterium]